MDTRTREYVEGRFRDYYQQADIRQPPHAEAREWGIVPWTDGSDEELTRHRSLADLGDLGDFFGAEGPKHVYFSAATYDQPTAETIDEKGWQAADLVVYINADHIPRVDADKDTYAEKLVAAKKELIALLETAQEFAFDDVTVVFSGDRGYHVHIRDEDYRTLDNRAREELVDYLAADGLGSGTIARLGDEQDVVTVTDRLSMYVGGWQRRFYEEFVDYVHQLKAMDEDDAVAELAALPNIGKKSARSIYGSFESGTEAFEVGQFEEAGFYSKRLVTAFANNLVEDERAIVDAPVTTDVNHLIRCPGSLHGGTGLRAARVQRERLHEFDPLADAVPSLFADGDVTVDVTEPGEYAVGGEVYDIETGEQTLPESLGVFLMARGHAEKTAE